MTVIFYAWIWTVEIERNSTNSWAVIYYSVGAAMFNTGWAAVQISHLALTGDLSADENCRTRINSARHSFSIASALIVFLSYLLFIDVVKPTGEMSVSKYRYVAIVVLCVGVIASVIFHKSMHDITVKKEDESGIYDILDNAAEECVPIEIATEDSSIIAGTEVASSSNDSNSNHILGEEQSISGDYDDDGDYHSEQIQNWQDWFHEITFYIVGCIYVLSRCASNITMIYMSFFLIKTMEMADISLALVPATMYLSSFLITFRLQKFNKALGQNQLFVIGAVTIILGSTSCAFLDTSVLSNKNLVYVSAILFGTGTAITTVGSVTLITDLVGDNLRWGAFVYGSISFADKLSCGILVVIIQLHRNSVCVAENDEPDSEECRDFVRVVISVIPSVSAFIAIICVFVLATMKPLSHRAVPATSDTSEVV